MRALLLASLLATLASSACSDETGILVQTTTESGFVGSIDSLTFYVGAEIEITDNGDEFFIDEEPFSEDLDEGRNLADSPHKFLIRPPQEAAEFARYAVGVVAYSNGERVGYGYIQDPIGFIKGSVVQWDIEIRDIADALPTDCIRWALDDSHVISIGAGDDMDCDGFAIGPDDCADDDPTRNIASDEICGNMIDDNCDGAMDGLEADGVTPVAEAADGTDNNCDGICDGPEIGGQNILDSDNDGFTSFGRYGVCNQEQDGPYDCDTTKGAKYPGAWDYCDNANSDENCNNDVNEPTPCFQQLDGDGRCLQGIRACPDDGYNCEIISQDDEVVSYGLACEVVQSCIGEANRALCVLLGLREKAGQSANCKTFHSATTGVCSTGGGKVLLPGAGPNGTVGPCTYQIIGPETQQGYRVKLDADSGGGGQMVHRCDNVSLEIETTLASARATILVGYSNAGLAETDIIKVNLVNRLTDDCETATGDGLECTAFAASVPAN